MEQRLVTMAAHVEGMRFSEVSKVVQKIYCISRSAWTARRVSQKWGRIRLEGAMMWRMEGPAETARVARTRSVTFCSQMRGQRILRRLSRSSATRNCITRGHLTDVQTTDMPMQIFIIMYWESW